MTVRVFCFATLRDHFAPSEFAVSLPAHATGRDLLACLGERQPRAAPLLRVCRLAVGCEYVPSDSSLRDGDDVAVIPPVSGG